MQQCVAFKMKFKLKITKDSELIAEWYSEAECRRNIYSATKSFTSCAVGFAVQ